jgi:hypothetical protein
MSHAPQPGEPSPVIAARAVSKPYRCETGQVARQVPVARRLDHVSYPMAYGTYRLETLHFMCGACDLGSYPELIPTEDGRYSREVGANPLFFPGRPRCSQQRSRRHGNSEKSGTSCSDPDII